MTSGLFVGCNTPAEKVENAEQKVIEANKELDLANAEYLADIEAYRIETAKRIASNDSTILAFKAHMKLEKKEAMDDYEEQLAELEQKNSDMEKEMDEYNGDGKDKWEIFKESFGRDMEELGEAIKDLTVRKK